jgi:hypothetical protein
MDERILFSFPDRRPQGHENLENRRMEVLGVRQVHNAAAVRLKPSEQRLGIFHPTLPF